MVLTTVCFKSWLAASLTVVIVTPPSNDCRARTRSSEENDVRPIEGAVSVSAASESLAKRFGSNCIHK